MHVGMKKKVLSTLMTILLFIGMFVINFPVNTQAQETQYVTVYVGDNVSRLTGDNAPKPSFEEPRGDIIPLTKVKYEAGDTAFTVLLKAANTAGITVDYSNEQNVNGIDGLSTYDGGKMSGWMVDVNGPFLNVAASSFPIQPNDYVEWQYSCSWGSDIGADWMAPLSNRISKIKMLEGSVSPKFDPDNLNYSFLVDNTTQNIQLHPVLENGLGKDGSLKKVEITSQGVSYKSYQSIPVKNDTKIIITVGEAGDNLKYTISIKDINSEINGLETWLKDYVKSVFDDAPAGEIVSPAEYNWPTIGLARLGNYEGLDKYLAENKKYLAKTENWDKLKKGVKVTEFERMSLAIGAAKGDPRDFAGKDLIAEIYNFPAVAYNGYPEFAQGTNGAIFALIAIDSMRYEIPEDAVWSRDKMINAILNNQLPDGGFALSKATSGAKSDPDLTAMAIQALAPYKDDAAKPEVKSAIDKAVEYLGVSQQSDGGYKSVSSESTSQVIIALCSIGIDIDTDPRFIKTTNSLLSNLLTFRAEDGGFKHILNSGSNSMASEQALLAFASYVRFKTNQQTLFDYHAESAKDIADGINSVSAPAAEATRLTMPTVPEGFTIAIKTSSNKDVIATSGKITSPVKATKVNLIFTVTKSTDGSTADTKSLSVTVPKGTSTSDIAAGIKSIKAPAAGATCLIMPSVPTGFTIVLKSSSNPDVIATDGTITSPVKATKVNLVFTVTRTTDSSTADTKSLSVTVPKGISARDIAAGIKSIKAPAAGATSLTMPSVPTGFTIVLKSSSNPGVIAIDGTITPPEKASKVNLVFTVTKTINSSTAATKSISVTVPKKKTTVSKVSAGIMNVSSQPIPVHSVSTQAVPSLSALTSYRVMENSSSAQERISGVDRYGTAVEIAKNHFPAGAATVILARGDVAADALPAVPLAKKYKAPLLLTPYEALPNMVFTEIKELGATNVIIIGGEGAVSKNVADALTQVGITVNRVFGANHYGTAYEIAKILGNNEQAVIVNGDYTKSFPDALSISSWAAYKGVPILYADASDLIPQATEKAIKELGITKTILIGGTAVLPQSLTKVLPNAQRYAGQDLYETNIKVLSELQPNPVAVYATTGKDFSDALSIAAVAGLSNAWVLLTQSNGLTEEQMQLLRSANTGVSSFQVMGGTMVMQDKVLTQLQQILGKDIAKTDTNTDTSTNKGEETNNNQETNEDEDEDQNQNQNIEVVSKKGVATIAIDCQAAVDNGLHEQDKFKNAVPEDGIILQETSVDFKKSQTVFDVLKRILAKKKIHMSYEGSKSTAYIQEINHLGEFDGGPTSGWMYSVNGDYPKVSCGACDVKDGDVINWSYTCNLGVDLGQEIPED